MTNITFMKIGQHLLLPLGGNWKLSTVMNYDINYKNIYHIHIQNDMFVVFVPNIETTSYLYIYACYYMHQV